MCIVLTYQIKNTLQFCISVYMCVKTNRPLVSLKYFLCTVEILVLLN